jgi:hypothetical protein
MDHSGGQSIDDILMGMQDVRPEPAPSRGPEEVRPEDRYYSIHHPHPLRQLGYQQ